MKIRKYSLVMALLSFMLIAGCQNTNMEEPGGSTSTQSFESLPSPANDTVEMLLNGQRHTLTQKIDCQGAHQNIGTDIGFIKSAQDNSQTLFVEGADLTTAAGNIQLNRGGLWSMDLDDGAGQEQWLPIVAGCQAQIVESSATIFELYAQDCKLRNAADTKDGVLSFKLRCVKVF